MDLTQLANLGEFIGGVAVLVTLINLAVQVKGNTQAERAETYRSLVQDLNRSFFDPMRDQTLAPILRKAAAGFDTLSGDEQMVAGAFYASALTLGQQAHSLHLSGNIDPEFAAAVDTLAASLIRVPGVAAWWSSMETIFAPEFRSHLQKVLNSEDCPPPFTEFMPWFSETPASEPKP